MNKSEEIRTTKDLVKNILITNKKTRSSDNYLYFSVCEQLGKERGIDIHSMSMPNFFLHMREYGFPSYETVGRCRRKLQETYPQLAAEHDVEAQRTLNNDVFRDFARGY